MEKILFTLLLMLMLAAASLPGAPPVLAMASRQVVSADNASGDESQGAIDPTGAKLGAGTGTSGN